MVQRVLCFPGYGQNAITLDVKVSIASDSRRVIA